MTCDRAGGHLGNPLVDLTYSRNPSTGGGIVCELQLTSLPLEILFYFGGLYDIIFFVLTFLLFLYKG